jgi:CheY-like chemotaxis protein
MYPEPGRHNGGDLVAETIASIAALLWPLLLLAVLLLLRSPLVAVMRSAEQREWTLEVGGQKLTMKQLSDQQNNLITDMQAQMGVLLDQVASLRPSQGDGSSPELDLVRGQRTARVSEVDVVPHAVLWVDDSPANNALIVEQLLRNSVHVDVALTTREGLDKLDERPYGAVLSDMRRVEDGASVSDAGIKLLHAVRETHPTIPFLIYCGPDVEKKYRDEASSAGANVITASPVVLSAQLRSFGLL